MSIQRVAVIGWDCAEPSLVFDRWRDDLPNLSKLMDRGTYGPLTSSIPPITVPAWSCMASSKDPGTLGIYGFRNRKDHTYDGLAIATSMAVREPRLWDILSARGRDNIIVGVPGTYPIVKPPRGCMITSFLTPDTQADYAHPPVLKTAIEKHVGEYMVDVRGFRTDNKQWLLEQIYEMTRKRHDVIKMLLRSQPWDLFWMVEMGHDRIHHGFWQYMDPSHHRYEPGNPFENAIHDYYVYTDGLIGELVEIMDEQKTAVWVVSDHGAKCMVGGFCFNQWLMQRGDLTLKAAPPEGVSKFDISNVDWSKTRAWAEGGYYGRLFINVEGREPEGTVPAHQYETFRDELRRDLEALVDHENKPMGTVAYKPEALYKTVNRVAPDLVVIFGDLRWRSVGSIGHSDLYTFENDTGPDDANHAQDGMYLYAHPDLPSRGYQAGPTLYDVAPSVLSMLGEPVPEDMQGRSLC